MGEEEIPSRGCESESQGNFNQILLSLENRAQISTCLFSFSQTLSLTLALSSELGQKHGSNLLSGQVGVTQTSQEGQLSEPGRLVSRGPLPFLIWASGVRQPLLSCQRLASCTPSRTCHRVPGFMPELQKECVKLAEPQSVTCKCKTFSRLRGKHAGDFIRTNGQWPQKWHWDPGAWPDEWKESTQFYSVNDEDP